MRYSRLLVAVAIIGVLALVAAFELKNGSPAQAQHIDNACKRKLGFTSVQNGKVTYSISTNYTAAVDHAVDVWGEWKDESNVVHVFQIPFEPRSVGNPDVSLTYQDASVPKAGWYGVTLNMLSSADVIVFNEANVELPPFPDTEDFDRRDKIIRYVFAHETGHALKLDHVRTQGQNTCPPDVPTLMIRELEDPWKQSTVFYDVPMPADIANYCEQWGGDGCEDGPAPPDPSPTPLPTPDPDAVLAVDFYAVNCEQVADAAAVTIDQAHSVPPALPAGCEFTPPGVEFTIDVNKDGIDQYVVTDATGAFQAHMPQDLNNVEVGVRKIDLGGGPVTVNLLNYDISGVKVDTPCNSPCRGLWVNVRKWPIGRLIIERRDSGERSYPGPASAWGPRPLTILLSAIWTAIRKEARPTGESSSIKSPMRPGTR